MFVCILPTPRRKFATNTIDKARPDASSNFINLVLCVPVICACMCVRASLILRCAHFLSQASGKGDNERWWDIITTRPGSNGFGHRGPVRIRQSTRVCRSQQSACR